APRKSGHVTHANNAHILHDCTQGGTDMPLSPLAGKPAPRAILTNIPRLISAYYTHIPDPENPAHQVAFGTSGHRGSSVRCSFNERHILAITQAICDYRRAQEIDGPLFL